MLVFENTVCRVGLPPSHYEDIFQKRSTVCGSMKKKVTHAAYSPEGLLYVVADKNLYRGEVPTRATKDWFSNAQEVGKGEWEKIKSIFFSSDSKFYVATEDGELFEGPTPDNVHESWRYRKAHKVTGITADELKSCLALFFNHDMLYAISNCGIKRWKPSTEPKTVWKAEPYIKFEKPYTLWRLTKCMGFDSQNNLWCVCRRNGRIYKLVLTTENNPPQKIEAKDWKAAQLGEGYDKYDIILFIEDRQIKEITDVEFHLDHGKVFSLSPEVVAEQHYTNEGSSVNLDCTFSVNKTFNTTSNFKSDDHYKVLRNLTIEGKIPILNFAELKFTLDFNGNKTWNFSKPNIFKVDFSDQFHFQVPPGKKVKQTAMVQKAEMMVPYTAQVTMMYGKKTTMSGMWEGVCFFELQVKQSDENIGEKLKELELKHE